MLTPGEWQKIGCYNNRGGEKALPQTFATFAKMPKSNPVKKQEFCADKAKEAGYIYFSVDDKGCHGSETAGQTYKKFGESEDCDVNNTGYGVGKDKYGSMFVYKEDK